MLLPFQRSGNYLSLRDLTVSTEFGKVCVGLITKIPISKGLKAKLSAYTKLADGMLEVAVLDGTLYMSR